MGGHLIIYCQPVKMVYKTNKPILLFYIIILLLILLQFNQEINPSEKKTVDINFTLRLTNLTGTLIPLFTIQVGHFVECCLKFPFYKDRHFTCVKAVVAFRFSELASSFAESKVIEVLPRFL